MQLKKLLPLAAAATALPVLAFAQDAGGETAQHTQFILTSVLFLLGGILVF